jgi:hypothetical protein
MFSRLRSAITYANTVSTIALFLALGGAAYAAVKIPSNSVGTKQIKNGAVTKSKISASAKAALRGNTGPRGLQGIQGIQGPTGTYPTVLPSGETQTGAFAIRFPASAASQSADAEVSFPLPLSSAPTVGYGGVNTTDCSGTVTAPTAAPGYFCVYFGQHVNAATYDTADPSGNSGVIGSIGGSVTIASSAAGDTIVRGTWAVTAP